MTRTTNARVAGIAFLAYIALGIASMILSNRATSGEGIPDKLASMVQHASAVHAATLLTLLCGFAAIVLGVTLWALTRDQDRDLAMLAMACRVAEGVIGGVAVQGSVGLLWLARAGANAPSTQGAHDIAAFLQYGQGWTMPVSATFFAVGSTIFSWLLLRGRMIPVPLAWLGVLASALVVVTIPLELAEISVSGFVWMPMALYEVVLAGWLIVKGAAMPAPGARTA